MPTVKLTQQQCDQAAMCCRIGAVQDRKDAANQTSLVVKSALEESARYREELAELFKQAK
jgi:hypothetical protein